MGKGARAWGEGACMRACVRASMRACVHACVRACVHACVRACASVKVRCPTLRMPSC